MSRVEDNQVILDGTPTSYNGQVDKVQTQIMANQIGILMDISKSLAVIVDALTEEEKNG